MSDIFLSYAREDVARAEQVAHALQREGHDVFWDREIPPGVSWADHIEEKLTACRALVVLWSASSTRSKWVREEARVALEAGKLLPAMLDGSGPPLGFGEVQAVNLATWQGEQAHPDWTRLLSGLHRLGQRAVKAGPAALRVEAESEVRASGPPNPDVALAVQTARQAAQAAWQRASMATAARQAGHDAAGAARHGQPGFGTLPLPQGVVVGDIGRLQAFQPAPVTMSMGPQVVFAGVMRLTPGAPGFQLSAVTEILDGPTLSGEWHITDTRMDFHGRISAPGRFDADVREWRSPQGVTGIGIVAYASGELYEGEYRSDAPLIAPSITRHGLGVLHARGGGIQAQGRFAHDALVAPN